MSYILDALRRSDAEREREQAQVPNLFAQQPMGAGLRPAESERRSMPGWAWVVIGVALGVAVPAAWFGLSRPTPTVAVAPAAPSDRGVVSAPPPPVAAPPSVAAPPAPPAAVPQPAAPVAAPAERIATPPMPKPKTAPAPSHARETSVARSVDITARTPAQAASASEALKTERVPRLNELPESVRREIPALAFGGAVYSETPSARFVILNGLVHREQDRIAPELVVEQIKLKSAVLRYRDQRFEIAF